MRFGIVRGGGKIRGILIRSAMSLDTSPPAPRPPSWRSPALHPALPRQTIVVKYGGNAMTDEHLKQCKLRPRRGAARTGRLQHRRRPMAAAPDRNPPRPGRQKGEFIQGMRVTDAETMEVVEDGAGGRVNKDIVNLINQQGGKAVGLTGKDGNFIRAKKLMLENKDNPGDLIDVGRVGEITSIDPSLIDHLDKGAFIPVIAPIGVGRTAKPTTSTPTWWPARSPKSSRRKNSFSHHQPRGPRQSGNLLTGITPKEIDAMVEDGTLSGGMLPKIGSALDAARNGVKACTSSTVGPNTPSC